jgi:hypothetical protein
MLRAPSLLVVLTITMAGCGGGGPGPKAPAKPAASVSTVPGPPAREEQGIPEDLRVPDGVPRHSTGPADPRASRVIRAWLRALRGGHIARAASYFAQPSVVQNATPVLMLESRTARVAFNASFPCGAIATRIGSAGRFAIVTFRLTERVGGDCMGDAGHRAIGAIRVEHRKIIEWYRLRLPTDPRPQTRPRIDPGSNEA